MKKCIFKRIPVVVLPLFVFILSGCATTPEVTKYVPTYMPGIGVYLNFIVDYALEETIPALTGPPPEDLPRYHELLFEDGLLTVALCIGTEDLVDTNYDERGGGRILEVDIGEYAIPLNLYGREVIIDTVVVNNKEDLIKAFHEREVIFVYSHSRYGNGWALHQDGLDDPFRMQSDPIRIPIKELHGLEGEVVKMTSSHCYLKPNTGDIDRVIPYPGFQIIVGLSCTSKGHFMKELLKMRGGYPSLMILTTGAGSFLEMKFKIFSSFLENLIVGEEITDIVSTMNDVWQRIPQEFYEEHNIKYDWTPKRVINFSHSDI